MTVWPGRARVHPSTLHRGQWIGSRRRPRRACARATTCVWRPAPPVVTRDAGWCRPIDAVTAMYSFDGPTRAAAITDPTGAQTTSTFDPAGRVVETIGPDGATTFVEWRPSAHLATAGAFRGGHTTAPAGVSSAHRPPTPPAPHANPGRRSDGRPWLVLGFVAGAHVIQRSRSRTNPRYLNRLDPRS